ncbi:hypothetical protein [Clostridioides sp. ZZV14-5902]|uniref:hypothetical protein n=1 Tax=Clostridioides sp. ZZV14-5902 TaxID=2811486 RepID=UPI001D126BAC|nr:hypothetical protein [Clostridioides sp. ZZV14-5902]
MGIDCLISIISNKLGLDIYKFNDIYFAISKSGKVIFFTGYTSAKDIYNFIDELDMNEFYDEFNKSLTDKDKKEHINLKAFLWDLYIIAINCGEDGSISKIDKANLERDRFLARKKIIDSINKNKIKLILKIDKSKEECLYVENDISNLINEIEMIISPENQFDRLVSILDGEEESIEKSIHDLFKDEQLKSRIEHFNMDPNITSKQKLILYLEYIINTENYYGEEV